MLGEKRGSAAPWARQRKTALTRKANINSNIPRGGCQVYPRRPTDGRDNKDTETGLFLDMDKEREEQSPSSVTGWRYHPRPRGLPQRNEESSSTNAPSSPKTNLTDSSCDGFRKASGGYYSGVESLSQCASSPAISPSPSLWGGVAAVPTLTLQLEEGQKSEEEEMTRQQSIFMSYDDAMSPSTLPSEEVKGVKRGNKSFEFLQDSSDDDIRVNSELSWYEDIDDEAEVEAEAGGFPTTPRTPSDSSSGSDSGSDSDDNVDGDMTSYSTEPDIPRKPPSQRVETLFKVSSVLKSPAVPLLAVVAAEKIRAHVPYSKRTSPLFGRLKLRKFALVAVTWVYCSVLRPARGELPL